MTATDELRRLLDERGVEWTANDGKHAKETCWPYMGELTAAFAEYGNGKTGFACDMWCYTPEQAVEATLGRGECRMHRIPEACYDDIECSACGACLWGFQMDRSGHGVMSRPNYCPWCGRKVVDK